MDSINPLFSDSDEKDNIVQDLLRAKIKSTMEDTSNLQGVLPPKQKSTMPEDSGSENDLSLSKCKDCIMVYSSQSELNYHMERIHRKSVTAEASQVQDVDFVNVAGPSRLKELSKNNPESDCGLNSMNTVNSDSEESDNIVPTVDSDSEESDNNVPDLPRVKRKSKMKSKVIEISKNNPESESGLNSVNTLDSDSEGSDNIVPEVLRAKRKSKMKDTYNQLQVLPPKKRRTMPEVDDGGSGESTRKSTTKHRADEKVQREPIGEKTECPVCSKKFQRAFTLVRHMVDIHKIDRKEVYKRYYLISMTNIVSTFFYRFTIKTTTTECKHCGNFFGNIHKHVIICQKKLEEKNKKKLLPVTNPSGKAPRYFSRGGCQLLERWSTWVVGNTPLGPTSIPQYTAGLGRLINFWETNLPGFKADSLQYPLESGTSMPSLTSFLDTCTSPSTKKMAVQVYLHLCGLVMDIFDDQYTKSETFSLVERNAFRQTLDSLKLKFSKKMKAISEETKAKTAETAAERATDAEDLTYNPKRLKELLTVILKDPKLRKIVEDLNTEAPNVIRQTYNDRELQYALVSLLLTTMIGQRQHCIINMTIKEFRRAKVSAIGVEVAHVTDHKTFKRYGPAPVAFVYPGLYKATENLLKVFRY